MRPLKGLGKTFTHEALELKLRKITNMHQNLINALIEYIERHVFYAEKGRFLEGLPAVMREIEKEKGL